MVLIARWDPSEYPCTHSTRGMAGRMVRQLALRLDGEQRSVGQRRACEMEARRETRSAVGRSHRAAARLPATLEHGSPSGYGIGRRHVLRMAPGVLITVALAACADKPPPAEVTPFAFPAVGAGQKDTAQFGARSGPTVP